MRKLKNRSRIRLIVYAVILCTAFFAAVQTAYADMEPEMETLQGQPGTVISDQQTDAGEATEATASPEQDTATEPTDPPVKNGWEGRCYYRNGELLKGVQEVDGVLYYFHTETGRYQVNAYKTHNEKMYFFGSNGKGAVFSGICKLNDCYYSNGVKYTGTHNRCYYRNGRKYTGIHNRCYYRNGRKYTGTHNNCYYRNGRKYTGTHNNCYYRNGRKYTGTHNNCYYRNGRKHYHDKYGKKHAGFKHHSYNNNGKKYN